MSLADVLPWKREHKEAVWLINTIILRRNSWPARFKQTKQHVIPERFTSECSTFTWSYVRHPKVWRCTAVSLTPEVELKHAEHPLSEYPSHQAGSCRKPLKLAHVFRTFCVKPSFFKALSTWTAPTVTLSAPSQLPVSKSHLVSNAFPGCCPITQSSSIRAVGPYDTGNNMFVSSMLGGFSRIGSNLNSAPNPLHQARNLLTCLGELALLSVAYLEIKLAI